jgi:radical SAM protein with 4Fe4S-binding SPASM domain
MTRRCNLRCLHCYIRADDRPADELTTSEARTMIDDLAAVGCPVLLFSGGEPCLRGDLAELGRYAVSKGLRAVVSSNGTIIDAKLAGELADAGLSYVGISIDGAPATHDQFRQREGAFDAALRGIRNCVEAGLKAGVRFTLTRHNADELEGILDIIERERVPRFCMYHLVYAGRGADMIADDVGPQGSRAAVELLMQRAIEWHRRGLPIEILTTDNHADGVLIERYVREHDPGRLEEVQQLERRHGGCSAGRKFANIDAAGNVHPCQFWQHVSLGNVRERPFSAIWADGSNGLLSKLRRMPEPVTGRRCSRCRHNAICGGCRIRAEAVHADTWADDPACYLSDEEIGIVECGVRSAE